MTPSTTSWIRFWGESIGRWFGSGEGDRLGPLGEGDGGNGRVGGHDGGLEGGPPFPAPCGFLQLGGVAWLVGIAGGHTLLVGGKRGS